MTSIWMQTARLPSFEPLRGDLKTDVLIIGGGMAGLLCAYRLARAGADCALVEANTLLSGATGHTTAKITAQHGLIYHQLIRRFGREKAQGYLHANLEAVAAYRDLCQDLDCDFEEQDAFVYARDSRKALDQEMTALHSLGYGATLVSETPLPFPVAGAVRFPGQAQFHPVKFAAAISRGLRIYEHTRVQQLAPGRAVTGSGVIQAEKIIVATHFPMLNKHGAYFMKLYQHRSHVLAMVGAQALAGMYVDADDKGLSFRPYGDMLLLGGGSHRTGKKGGGWRELEAFAGRHYPRAQIAARWAAQDCMSLDGVPYIGRYARHTGELYVASGFNKWGMTSAMAAAAILADMALGRQHPLAGVFAPDRSSLRPQLLLNAAETAINLLTPTAPRCPHMGCALKYNRAEHSWDCPCHGSRFHEDGRVIDNPANADKQR